MEKVGRKRLYLDAAMDVYYARLTPHQARLARRFGGGNLSEGIRAAIDHMERCETHCAPEKEPPKE